MNGRLATFVLIALSIVGSLGAAHIGVPGAWLIVPLVTTLITQLLFRVRIRVVAPALVGAQAILGASVGLTLTPLAAAAVVSNWHLVLFSVSSVFVLGMIGVWLLTRVTNLAMVDAILGGMPGASSNMVMLSVSLGGDAGTVAVMQYTRLLIVIISAPIIANWLPSVAISEFEGSLLGHAARGVVDTPAVGYTLLLAATAGVLGSLTPIPAGALLLPTVVIAAASVLGIGELAMPAWVRNAAFLVLGVRAGAGLDREKLRRTRKLVPVMVCFSVLLSLSCAGIAGVISATSGIDFLTAYLATTPGGMDSILAIALDLGGTPAIVLAVQLTRLIVILLISPLIAKGISSLVSKAKPESGARSCDKTH